MNILEAIVLGLLQGLTEFIPVSSSGHLVIGQHLFGLGSDHTFLEWINLGTFLALLVYFRARIIDILRQIFVERKFRLARNILLTSIPAGVVGYLLASWIDESPFFGSLVVVMVTLAVVGGLMIILERLPKLSKTKDGEHLTMGRALTIGIAQMAALIPGVSRSGSTIITGRLMGLNPATAAEYSFLASLPIMAGVTLKVFIKDFAYLEQNMAMLLVANFVAFVSGLIAVGFLMRFLAKHSLVVFGWYRIALAAVIGIVLLIQL
ncbi:MAG TPA: undecaprenyl-diphosphate phosphatase [Candidatus Saccharimonadales bacterium]